MLQRVVVHAASVGARGAGGRRVARLPRTGRRPARALHRQHHAVLRHAGANTRVRAPAARALRGEAVHRSL